MTLGQAAFNGGTAGSATGTFIHELVRTQDRSDRREHMFTISRSSHSYGADGTHYDVEAVPNLAATYQEGIANAVMMTVDGAARRLLRLVQDERRDHGREGRPPRRAPARRRAGPP